MKRSYPIIILGGIMLGISTFGFQGLNELVMNEFPSAEVLMSFESIPSSSSNFANFYYDAKKEVSVVITSTPQNAPVFVHILGPNETNIKETMFNDKILISLNSSHPEGFYQVGLINFATKDVVINAMVSEIEFSDIDEKIFSAAREFVALTILFLIGILVLISGFIVYIIEIRKKKKTRSKNY